MKNETFEILRVESDYIYAKKTIRGGIDTVEATPHVWAMSLVEIRNGSVTIKTGREKRHFPTGTYCSFLPPFSFIEYHGTFESMQMLTFSSTIRDRAFPTRPIVFPIESVDLFSSVSGVSDWVRENLNDSEVEPVEIGRGHNPSCVSRKIKQLIDSNYHLPFKLSQLAARLQLSQALLTMHFKKDFYLPPVKYRNCLRIIESQMRLLKARKRGTKIIDIAQDVGFNDLSQFNRQFKTYFGRTPRAFLID